MKKNKFLPVIMTATLLATPFTALAATERLAVDKETADYITVNSDGSQYFVFAVKKEAVASTEEQAQASEVQQNDTAAQNNQQTAATNTKSNGANTQQSNKGSNQNTPSTEEVFEEMAATMDAFMQEYQNQASQQTQQVSEQPVEQPAPEPVVEQPETVIGYMTGDGQVFYQDQLEELIEYASDNDTNWKTTTVPAP